ncbi:hypothetical protein [Amycolatopsis magusensis]|uniref:hypothetical protein n=1 Tax=Amycolatopsis magusensis TaxID=882444 RepID=UPI0024A8A063|nr:hypothetical protein [Amycolatopsis magusensis]MDI5976375.1 hypothetical protein [Amycolatopsis magusensis]
MITDTGQSLLGVAAYRLGRGHVRRLLGDDHGVYASRAEQERIGSGAVFRGKSASQQK